MAGQTINDRLLAARHSLAGQGLAKSVCKATTEEMIGPKKKHLDCKWHFDASAISSWPSRHFTHIIIMFILWNCVGWRCLVVCVCVCVRNAATFFSYHIIHHHSINWKLEKKKFEKAKLRSALSECRAKAEKASRHQMGALSLHANFVFISVVFFPTFYFSFSRCDDDVDEKERRKKKTK